jgi:hypothetical protein
MEDYNWMKGEFVWIESGKPNYTWYNGSMKRVLLGDKNVDFKKIAQKGTDFSLMVSKGRDVSHLIGKADYIDFKALGYKGDPVIHGGRFKKLPMGCGPQKKDPAKTK